jgi:hypothetical protein
MAIKSDLHLEEGQRAEILGLQKLVLKQNMKIEMMELSIQSGLSMQQTTDAKVDSLTRQNNLLLLKMDQILSNQLNNDINISGQKRTWDDSELSDQIQPTSSSNLISIIHIINCS